MLSGAIPFGTWSAQTGTPAVVGVPAVSKRSLGETSTPCTGTLSTPWLCMRLLQQPYFWRTWGRTNRRHIDPFAATLPPVVAEAARERGRSREPQPTVKELSIE